MIYLRITEKDFRILRTIYDISVEKGHETCALGTVTKDPKIEKTFILSDIIIPKQKVSSATTDIDPEYLVGLVMKGRKFNFWFHTHPNIACSFSSVDDDTIEKLCRKGEYFFSMIIADNHDIYARIDVMNPIRATLEVKIEVIEGEDSALKKKLIEEIKNKAKFSSFMDKFAKKHYLTTDNLDYQRKRREPDSIDLCIQDAEPHRFFPNARQETERPLYDFHTEEYPYSKQEKKKKGIFKALLSPEGDGQ